MKYLSKSFSVAFEGDAYRAGYDKIDWGRCRLCDGAEEVPATTDPRDNGPVMIPCPSCVLGLNGPAPTLKCLRCHDTGKILQAAIWFCSITDFEGKEIPMLIVPCPDCQRP